MKNSKEKSSFFSTFLLLVCAVGALVVLLFLYKPKDEVKVGDEDFETTKWEHREEPSGNVYVPEAKQQIKVKPEIKTPVKPEVAEKKEKKKEEKKEDKALSEELKKLLDKGIELVDQGSIEDATKIFQDILKKDPTNESALLEMAMIEMIDHKNPAGAVPYFQRALSANPKSGLILSELVSLWGQTQQFDEGRAYLQDMIKKNPDQANLTHGMGQLYLQQKDYESAATYFEKSDRQSPSIHVKSKLAMLYDREGKVDKALEVRKRALDQAEVALDNGSEKKSQGPMKFQYAQASRSYESSLRKNGNEGKANEVKEKREEKLKSLGGTSIGSEFSFGS